LLKESKVRVPAIAILNRCSRLLFAWILLLSLISTSLAQSDSGAVNITGRVSPALKLSLEKGWRLSKVDFPKLRIEAHDEQMDSLQITIGGENSGLAGQFMIPLEIRTNVPYELNLVTLDSDNCSPIIKIYIESARPYGSLVARGAAEVYKPAEPLELAQRSSSVTLLAGPRVSAGGNFATHGNALRVNLKLNISEQYGEQCPWFSSFRLSLKHSPLARNASRLNSR
jgi:hypothetical protein